MAKYIILAEGKSDIVFIRDYLLFNYDILEIAKDDKKEKILKYNDTLIKIVAVGGYTVITKHLNTKFQEIKDSDYKILIIQDADSVSFENGGIDKRTEYLDKIKKELEIEFETFLFPNNEDEGDLETLLLQIVNLEKFSRSINCYEKYAKCCEAISEKKYSEELLQSKSLVYNYFRTYNGMEKAKEENRKFHSVYWNFSNEALRPFNLFINRIFERINVIADS